MPVDSYHFLDPVTRNILRHWAALAPDRPIPWTPLPKPLSKCTIALVSSAALALNADPPFDLEIERQDPWFSDPSCRVIPRETKTGQVQVCHLHINPDFAIQDLNSVLPLEPLAELATPAPSHYSYSGYTLRPERLLRETVPAIIERMRLEGVDAAVLVPV